MGFFMCYTHAKIKEERGFNIVKFSKKFNNTLVDPLRLSAEDKEQVREVLIAETESMGLRNVDVEELTGWPKAKVSKIMSRKQGLDDKDIRIWTGAYGLTPDMVIGKTLIEAKELELNDYVRSIDDCIKAFSEAESENDRSAILNEELPRSIIATLGVRATDYVIRSDIGRRPGGEHFPDGLVSYIDIIYRNFNRKIANHPYIRFIISPDEKIKALLIGFNVIHYTEDIEDEDKNVAKEQRLKIQELAPTLDNFENERRFFARYNKKDDLGLNSFDDEESVLRVIVWDDEIEDQKYKGDYRYKSFEKAFEDIFDYYCHLVYDLFSYDIASRRIKKSKGLMSWAKAISNVLFCDDDELDDDYDDEDEDDYIKANNEQEKRLNSWKETLTECEFGADHESFLNDEGKKFMFVVPLVRTYPLEELSEKACMANAVALCPNCASKLHYGKRDDREEMVLTLYKKRQGALKDAGIGVSLRELLEMYNL